MTNEDKETVREKARGLTNGTLMGLITTYMKVSLHTPLGVDDDEMKTILCQEARSRGIMR